jgi:hypothetical protein
MLSNLVLQRLLFLKNHWRKLPRIAHNNQFPANPFKSQEMAGKDLACLIYDSHVESIWNAIPRSSVGEKERRSQNSGGDRCERCGRANLPRVTFTDHLAPKPHHSSAGGAARVERPLQQLVQSPVRERAREH